jgi:hypothetical protein
LFSGVYNLKKSISLLKGFANSTLAMNLRRFFYTINIMIRDYTKCENCNDYHWDNEKCDPVYLVNYPDYMGDEKMEIRASSFEDAAQNYAEHYNVNNEYDLMDKEIEISIERDGIIKHFSVSAQPDVNYSYSEINPL